jgi:hypothetical protein
MSADHIGCVSLERHNGAEGRHSYGRRSEEFAADFCLVSKRHLTPAQYQLFKFHFLLGADWKLCCRRLKMERGAFFHEVYRIEKLLGEVFATLQPYALYPVDEYFGTVITRAKANVIPLTGEINQVEIWQEPVAA